MHTLGIKRSHGLNIVLSLGSGREVGQVRVRVNLPGTRGPVVLVGAWGVVVSGGLS